MEQFIVSARKYRPQNFASVVGQKSITTTLKNAIVNNHLAHAYLFCGSRGVGKTTCARIFAKTINCSNLTAEQEACNQCESCKAFNENRSYNIHELDGATNNGVDEIRSLVEKVRIPPQIGRKSVYIIDEVHMLSKGAFNAFLKTLEEPPAHAIFILATTEKHKILPTILSRCQIYDFHRIKVQDTVDYLKYIAQKENIPCEDDALHVIAQKSEGAMRDALSTFDQIVSFCNGNLTYQEVIRNLNILDYDYYFKLVDAALNSSYKDILLLFDEILSKGFDAQYFVLGICNHLRDLMVCKDTETLSLLETSDNVKLKYKEQSEKCEIQYLIDALILSNQCDIGYRTSSNPRLHVELYLLQIANLAIQKKNEEIELPDNSSQNVEQNNPVALPHNQVQVSNAPPKVRMDTSKLSIKNILNQEVVRPSSEPSTKQVQQQILKRSFSQEELITAWNSFIATLSQQQVRLSVAMQAQQPTFKVNGENIELELHVFNDLQKNEIEKHQTEILQYLAKFLENTMLSLEITVVQPDEKERVLLLPQDLIKKFADENPDFIIFKQQFGLDYE